MPSFFDVISIHFTTECGQNCPMCYRPKDKKAEKDEQFFLDMIPYLKELCPQIALGGGEPYKNPDFVADFSRIAKGYKLLTNVTTNGKESIPDYAVKNIEMVSVSFDQHKIKNIDDFKDYIKLTHSLKKKTRVGANMLVDNQMVSEPDIFLKLIVRLFYQAKVERVFALYPKNWEFLDILKIKEYYQAFTSVFKHFYIDDLTNKILCEESYCKWKKPCHYGKSIISINEDGYVTGCSFDGPDKALLKLDKPKDILKIRDVVPEERYSCPYLKCNGGCGCQQSMKGN